MFTITFERRDFRGPRLLAGLSLRVERLEWRALGGPWSARIRAAADTPERLWSLADLLRCGLAVHDERGPAWWGCVSAVEIYDGARGARMGLDGMANAAAARYRAFHPDTAGGALALTPFVTDARSAQVYGEKQRIIEIGQAAEAEALAAARGFLAQNSLPRAVPVSPGAGAGGGPRALIEARGWWDTLDWKIAAEPRGQVANRQAGAGQPFGDPGQQKTAQSFTTGADPWQAAEAWLRLRRFGPCADAARLELCADAGGAPGAALASAALPAGQIADDWGWARFLFPAPVRLPAGSYWLVLSRSGPLSSSLYYLASADQGCGLAGGQALVYNGSSWSARVPPADLSLYVTGVEETTEQVRRLLLPEQCGQFLRGARIEQASGVPARMHRPIEEAPRGREAVEALLARGTAGGGRLLARVEPDRTARIYPQPPPERAALVIGADGEPRQGRRPLAPSEQPAGQWARLEGPAPAGSAPPGVVFIEGCAWEGGRLRVA